MPRRLGQYVILQHDLLIVAMLCTPQAALLADQPPVCCLAALEDRCRPRLLEIAWQPAEKFSVGDFGSGGFANALWSERRP